MEIIPVYKFDLEQPNDQSTSSVVIQCISGLIGQEPTELEPLGESVDPEAIDSIVARAEETATSCRFAFEYQGYTIKINVDDGEIRIAPSDESLLTKG